MIDDYNILPAIDASDVDFPPRRMAWDSGNPFKAALEGIPDVICRS